jgi:transposase
VATDALDDIRCEVWNEARRAGQRQLAAELKGARFARWKNPGNLTEQQQLKLARTITEQRQGIEAALCHGLSDARVKSVNTQLG